MVTWSRCVLLTLAGIIVLLLVGYMAAERMLLW
jgi:hypothetical protein